MMAGLSEPVKQSLLETTVYPKRLGGADEYAALAVHIAEKHIHERLGDPLRRRAPHGSEVADRPPAIQETRARSGSARKGCPPG